MEAVVEDVSAKPQVTVFVSKLCEVFVVEILMLLKCISSSALCIKFLSIDMWSWQLQSWGKWKKCEWSIQGGAIINMNNGQEKLGLNLSISCLISLFTGDAVTLALCSWWIMEIARCYQGWRLPEKDKLMHNCQDVVQLSYFHFEFLVLTCMLKNKTVIKLNKSFYRVRTRFVEEG